MRSKIVVLAACCALALATAACSPSSAPTDPYTDFTLLPPTPLDQLVGRATTIVTGHVVSVGDGVAELKVDGVLKGVAPVGGELAVSAGTRSFRVGEEGVWVLTGDIPPAILAGGENGASLREVERILGGLLAGDQPPTPDSITAEFASADAVVYAQMSSDDGQEADVVTLEVLKGDVPKKFTALAPKGTSQAGGPWTFYRADGVFGTLFLKREGDAWRVINSSDPTLYYPEDVTAAASSAP